MLCQKKQKIKKLQFLNQLPLSFSDLDTHGLTSHVDKLVKLLFFKAENIAISFSVFFVVFLIHIKLPYSMLSVSDTLILILSVKIH